MLLSGIPLFSIASIEHISQNQLQPYGVHVQDLDVCVMNNGNRNSLEATIGHELESTTTLIISPVFKLRNLGDLGKKAAQGR